MLALPSASDADEGQVIEFWYSMTGDKGKLLDALVAEFNARPENRGRRKVVAQFIGTYIEGLNKIRTAMLSGRGPHVAQVFDIGTKVMIDSGGVVPLQRFIEKDPEFPINLLLNPIRKYYEVNGVLYSLPFSTSNPILYYNEALFKKAGIFHPARTLKELGAQCKQLANPATGQTGLTWPLHSWFFEQFLARQGVALANEENGRKHSATHVYYDAPEAVGFVEFWNELVKDGCFAHVGRKWDPAQQNFLAGRSAMLITSTSEVFEIQKEARFKVGTAALPRGEKDVPGGTIIGGNALWIFSAKPAEEQNAAYAFVKFMASKEIQKQWHTGTGYFPIRTDVIDELKREGFYEKNPGAWTAIQQLQASANVPATWGALLPAFQEAREHIESAIESVLSAKESARDALSRAKIQTEKALERYNRKQSG